ncbi:MAG: hypothetical protein O6940_02830 [Ignavibacteria bacterium]|nr:hypothetical protein [Ignavibacteria bacterium]
MAVGIVIGKKAVADENEKYILSNNLIRQTSGDFYLHPCGKEFENNPQN